MNMPHTNGHGATAIQRAFAAARDEGRSALIPYIPVGYPSPAATRELVPALQAGGADLIELGVPFSDPVADGPTIQRATYAALQAGVTPATCLEMAGELRARGVTVPLVLMGYYNPILRYGPERYAADCHRLGVDGLIVPDLPLEEAGPLRHACQAEGLGLIQLVAPTSDEARIAQLAAATSGFLYVVSRLGITGAGLAPGAELGQRMDMIQRHARTPIAVGFGISAPEHVRTIAPYTDGVIVGSAVVEHAPQGTQALRGFVAALREATARGWR